MGLRVAFFVNPLAGLGAGTNQKGSDHLKLDDCKNSTSIPASSEDPYLFETRCGNLESHKISEEILREIISQGDSIGAGIRTVIRNMPVGLGLFLR